MHHATAAGVLHDDRHAAKCFPQTRGTQHKLVRRNIGDVGGGMPSKRDRRAALEAGPQDVQFDAARGAGTGWFDLLQAQGLARWEHAQIRRVVIDGSAAVAAA